MKIRSPKPEDQDKAEKAFQLILRAAHENPDIEPTIWIAACLSCVAGTFEASGVPYEEFFKYMKDSIIFYKIKWGKG